MDNFSLRILVVDDDGGVRQTLNRLITQSGYEFIEARDGYEGFTKALEFRPDVVITPRLLPAMSGMDLVRKIRTAADGYRPYVILAALPEEKKPIPETTDLLFDEFIDKPVQMEIVSAQLRAVQRIVSLQRENERYVRELQEYSEELICSNLRLRELAMIDDLTGLPNRRYSMELIQHEWSVAQKDDAPLSCMVIDLNGLKHINDEQGLERGDVVLKTVAAIMRKYLPPRDIVCRIDGDEFMVICPGAGLNAVAARGEKLVGLVSSFNIHAEQYSLGLSIGVAECRNGINGPQELIGLAEQAMHYAKRVGKNQVISGHGAEVRLVRGARQTEQPIVADRKKSKKQFSLWRQSDGPKIVVAGT